MCVPPPPCGEIHLWVRPPDPARIRPEPGTAAVHNARSQADLVMVLTRYAGPSPQFLRGPHGKPYLFGGPEFNLSHTAGATAVAVSAKPVGVDIESRFRTAGHSGIAERFFFPEERDAIASSSEPGQAFLRHWVRKESLCKWAGEGIYRGLRHAHAGLGGTPAFRGRGAWICEFGDEHGLLGALASNQPARVKMFVIC